ncbi:UDP-N-acetylglucosamine pyrophosphorylase [Nosema bombycis CQ1]|uniref:UDP-N-acetylglucosamine diphosphorylase n=1 Tax=Nosema bombycis (strain CQ1 / CVCC 102059) TaxID=578461 RepID=R0KMY9_NOSB1|nr:UDP-N-acetylglucosamine pyrophosphorylase [Nosema bombycis CQ1]|eukprot:EOB11502.1 UDP-N-acetylglucosamine pyrophosphorylase [Nosema bombycis CQ1]
MDINKNIIDNNKDMIDNFVCVLDNNDPSLFDLGVHSLKNNNFAVVILAGGQGSRLGSDLPKALFKLNGKSLIDYHIERIIKIQEDYGCSITLFIMVSSFTEQDIKKYLENNNFKLKIEIIKQEDKECKRINNNQNNHILLAPGGNGDVFKSLSNINLDSFLGINIISVDNVLAKVLDPNFVGGFIKNDLEILSKAVKKRENENVGVSYI